MKTGPRQSPVPSFDEFLEGFRQKGERVIVQTVIGRSGSFFLQSLFDDHPEMLMFPGALSFQESIAPALENNPESWPAQIESLCNAWHKAVHQNMAAKLGKNRDEKTELSGTELVSVMRNALGARVVTRKLLFLALHYGVGVCLKRDLRRISVIYSHEHVPELRDDHILPMRQDFPSALFLCTVRDPRSNYLSALRMKEGLAQFPQWAEWRYEYSVSYTAWSWYRFGLSQVNARAESFLLIRLEDLQGKGIPYVKALCERLGLAFTESLLETTFAGKAWWGDAFSPPSTGFRPTANAASWKKKLPRFKAAVLEILLAREMKALGYERWIKPLTPAWWMAWLTFPLWAWDDNKQLLTREYHVYLRRTGVSVWRSLFASVLKAMRFSVSLLNQTYFVRRDYSKVPGTIFKTGN